MQYHTSDAARACNVTLNTVRNWCKDYGAFLSPGAGVTSGQREFTGRDLEVFKYIALLRAEGEKKGAILQRLGETTFPEIDASQEDAHLTIVATPALQTAQEAQDSDAALDVALHAISTMQHDIAALKQAVSEGKQGQRDYVQGLALGFVLALLFMVLLLLLFLVRGYL